VLNFVDGAPFASGRAKYSTHDAEASEGSVKIFVRIVSDALEGPILAQLDTGAAWSVLNTEIARELGLLPGGGEVARLSTRLGWIDGRLERATISIVADEGTSVDIDATVFVSADWQGGTFLGYSGLLERIRFAVDPNPQASFFYFGYY